MSLLAHKHSVVVSRTVKGLCRKLRLLRRKKLHFDFFLEVQEEEKNVLLNNLLQIDERHFH